MSAYIFPVTRIHVPMYLYAVKMNAKLMFATSVLRQAEPTSYHTVENVTKLAVVNVSKHVHVVEIDSVSTTMRTVLRRISRIVTFAHAVFVMCVLAL